MKMFNINDIVEINEIGEKVEPQLAGVQLYIAHIHGDDNLYTVETEKGAQYCFMSEELDFYIEQQPRLSPFDYEGVAKTLGKLVADKQKAYGNSVDSSFDVMKAFLHSYKSVDGNYIIPEILLHHMLLMVRIIDKQNRIFSNPEGDLMGESPYNDMMGYSLLGVRMFGKKA